MKRKRFDLTKRLGLAALLIALTSGAAIAQRATDACHVYVVDLQAAQKAYESLGSNSSQEAQAKALSSVMKILGEFPALVGEEELTTKSFLFPDSKLIVTASIFYTDESMPADSISLGIVVSDKAVKDALGAPNNAAAEVNYNEYTKIARVRKNIEVNGRTFLVGLQCDHKNQNTPK
jgi:hypothetical protein